METKSGITRVALVVLMSSFSLTFSTTLPSALHADQQTFGPRIGRTARVSTIHWNNGDVEPWVYLNTVVVPTANLWDFTVDYLPYGESTTTMHMVVPSGGTVQLSGTSCDGSNDLTCSGLEAVNGCTWNNLTMAAKGALTLLLGSCTKYCQTFQVTTIDKSIMTGTEYRWSCQQQNQGECVGLAGQGQGSSETVHVVKRIGGCQF